MTVNDPHGYIAGARRVLSLLGLRPRIRFAYQARSIRAGILLTRQEVAPGGFVDIDLVDRAYFRTRIREAHRRRVGIRNAQLAPLLDWMDARLAQLERPLVDRGYPLQRFGLCSIEFRSTAGVMDQLYFVTKHDVARVDEYLEQQPVPNRPPYS